MIEFVLLVNILLMYLVAGIDRLYLNDAIEKSRYGKLLGLWSLVTILSIPALLGYWILNSL